MRRRWLLVVLCATLQPATAQVRPQPGSGDPRLQVVTFDPNQVVQLQVAQGYQLSVEFAPDERIENIAIGDPSGWSATPNKRGDHLFVKTIGPGSPTNMTVVTDARTYQFELIGGGGGQPFSVQFLYPQPASAEVGDDGTATAAAPAAVAGRYRLSGDKALRPTAMADDGVHTLVEWPPGRTLPAIFTSDGRGHEAAVNGAMRGSQFVIDAVANNYIFRLDRSVAYARREPRLRRR